MTARGPSANPLAGQPAWPLRDILAWDVVSWSAALPFWQSRVGPLAGRHCLEVGCAANGGLALWLALQGATVTASFYGEQSPEMAEVHARHQVSRNLRYVGGVDACRLSLGEKYDVIAFKSMPGRIAAAHRPKAPCVVAGNVFESIRQALRPGGWLIFAENLRATPLHRFLRNRFGAGRKGWYYFNREELLNSLAFFATVESMTCGFCGCFGRNERQRALLGRLDRVLFNSFLPPAWHYIFVAAARIQPDPATP